MKSWVLALFLVGLVVSAELISSDDPKLGPFDQSRRQRADTATPNEQPNCEAAHESYGQEDDSVAREFKEYAIAVDNEVCATEGK